MRPANVVANGTSGSCRTCLSSYCALITAMPPRMSNTRRYSHERRTSHKARRHLHRLAPDLRHAWPLATHMREQGRRRRQHQPRPRGSARTIRPLRIVGHVRRKAALPLSRESRLTAHLAFPALGPLQSFRRTQLHPTCAKELNYALVASLPAGLRSAPGRTLCIPTTRRGRNRRGHQRHTSSKHVDVR